jgi:hypothetical protein
MKKCEAYRIIVPFQRYRPSFHFQGICFLYFRTFFYPEGRGSTLLRNIGTCRNGNHTDRLPTICKQQTVTMCNGPTNALVCNKILIKMSHIKTLKITPKCFDHQLIIIRELFDPG